MLHGSTAHAVSALRSRPLDALVWVEHATRLLAFRGTIPHTGVPGAHGGTCTQCVHDPWGAPRHKERIRWPELRWIWRTKTTCK
jgi:hypothetical protein